MIGEFIWSKELGLAMVMVDEKLEWVSMVQELAGGVLAELTWALQVARVARKC
jgi:hypothetical protein